MKFKYGNKVIVKGEFYEGLTGTIVDYEDVSGIYGSHKYRYFIMLHDGYMIKNSIEEDELEVK